MNGQSRMDNQEWTIHTHNQLSKRYKQNKKKHTQKTKKLSSMDNKEKPEVKPGNRKKWPVPISYKTLAILFKIKSGKSLVSYTRRKKLHKNKSGKN